MKNRKSMINSVVENAAALLRAQGKNVQVLRDTENLCVAMAVDERFIDIGYDEITGDEYPGVYDRAWRMNGFQSFEDWQMARRPVEGGVFYSPKVPRKDSAFSANPYGSRGVERVAAVMVEVVNGWDSEGWLMRAKDPLAFAETKAFHERFGMVDCSSTH